MNMSLCVAHWFSAILLGVLLTSGRSKINDGDMRTSYACSSPSTGTYCNFLTIACPSGLKVKLQEATYNFSKTGTQMSGSGRQMNAASETPLTRGNTCTGTINANCEKNCCTDGQSDMKYSDLHLYNLFTQCSWKSTCKPKAEYYNGSSVSSVVKYTCIPENNSVTFCQNSKTQGNHISIIFENSTEQLGVQNITYKNISCSCVIRASTNFTMKVQDIRLLDANGTCLQSSLLFGLQPDKWITCSKDKQLLDMYERHVTDEHELLLRFDADNKPQMVWIEAKGTKDTSITVECYNHNAKAGDAAGTSPSTIKPTTTTSLESTSEIPTSETTSVLSTTSSQKPTTESVVSTPASESTSAHTKSSTILPSNIQTSIHTQSSTTVSPTIQTIIHTQSSTSVLPTMHFVQSLNEIDVPIAAIIIPTLFVFIGVAAGIFLWRRW